MTDQPTEEVIDVAKSIEERFWAKVDRSSDCWVWTAHHTEDGYGRFSVSASHSFMAHRFAWELLRGPIADGLELDHLCRARNCVRPEHLELVSHVENVLRGAVGDWQRAKTHCPHNHPYDETNTYWLRVPGKMGYRRCRTCQRRNMKAQRAKRKEGRP